MKLAIVTPAQAGVQCRLTGMEKVRAWIPACAGMTIISPFAKEELSGSHSERSEESQGMSGFSFAVLIQNPTYRAIFFRSGGA